MSKELFDIMQEYMELYALPYEETKDIKIDEDKFTLVNIKGNEYAPKEVSTS